MRAIDADALKMDIIEAGQRSRRYRPWDLNRDEIWDVIDAQPTIKTERKKGHWIFLKNGNAICSECRFEQVNAYDFENWDNFCHHCGADMRE